MNRIMHGFSRAAFYGLMAAAAVLPSALLSAAEPSSDSDRYTRAVRSFADTVIEHGRDIYGPKRTPLFVDGLQVETLEPVRWKKGGQTRNGLFPRAGRTYARTGDEVPLAMLHLAAAVDGRESVLPPPMLDNAFFHCEYDGHPGWKAPGVDDKRTYDSNVFYGD